MRRWGRGEEARVALGESALLMERFFAAIPFLLFRSTLSSESKSVL